MSKAKTEVPDLTDEQLAFEMIEITCDEMDSLTRAFEMISKVCRELNGEEETVEQPTEAPESGKIH